MDQILAAMNYLLDQTPLRGWPECAALMKQLISSAPKHWHLPSTTCLVVGGTSQQSIPAITAIIALHTSIVLVDDLLDNDRHFENLQFRDGDIANMAVALFGAGLQSILHSSLDEVKQHMILANLQDMMISTALGQRWDTHSTDMTEGEYWHITRQKSSPFFGSAFFIGAVAGGGQAEVAQNLAGIGRIYGEMIQVNDDLKDALSIPASKDWSAKRPSLPILYSILVDHPYKKRLLQLRTRLDEPYALREAQTILFRCGAVSYCAQALIQRYQSAMKSLDRIALPNREPINETLKKLITPVYHLFEKIGALPPIVS